MQKYLIFLSILLISFCCTYQQEETNTLETNFSGRDLEAVIQGIVYELVGTDPEVQRCIHLAESAIRDFEAAVGEFRRIHWPHLNSEEEKELQLLEESDDENSVEENHHHWHHHHHHWHHWTHHIGKIVHHDVHKVGKDIEHSVKRVVHDIEHLAFELIPLDDLKYIKNGLQDLNRGIRLVPRVIQVCSAAYQAEQSKISALINGFSGGMSMYIRMGYEALIHHKALLAEIKQARSSYDARKWFVFGTNIGKIIKVVVIGNEAQIEGQE